MASTQTHSTTEGRIAAARSDLASATYVATSTTNSSQGESAAVAERPVAMQISTASALLAEPIAQTLLRRPNATDDDYAALSIIDRLQEALDEARFYDWVLEGIDLLKLTIRHEHWLGRSLNRREMFEYVYAVVAANDGPTTLDLIVEQEDILVQANDGRLTVTWHGEHDPIRTVYDHFDGSFRLRDVFELALQTLRRDSAQDPAVSKVLALGVGERHVEDGYGPFLMTGTELENGRYPTYDVRLLVEREGTTPVATYRFEAQHRYGDGDWGPYDFGMGEQPGYSRFAKHVHSEFVGANLLMFRAMLGTEAAEFRAQEKDERERYGITDEHLLEGTLSAATRVEIESEEGIKVAA